MKNLPKGFRILDEDEMLHLGDMCNSNSFSSNVWKNITNNDYFELNVKQAKTRLSNNNYVFATKRPERIFKESFFFLQSLRAERAK